MTPATSRTRPSSASCARRQPAETCQQPASFREWQAKDPDSDAAGDEYELDQSRTYVALQAR
jgi:hypothetical protein